MLALARFNQEGVVIQLADGSEAEVVVLSVDRGKVTLGFKFPQNCTIARQELLEKAGSWTELRKWREASRTANDK